MANFILSPIIIQSLQSAFQSISNSINSLYGIFNSIGDAINGERIIVDYDLSHPKCTFLLKNPEPHVCNKPAKHFYARNNLVTPRCKKHKYKILNSHEIYGYQKVTLDELIVMATMEE